MSETTLERLTPDRRLSLDGEPVAPDVSGRISRITVELSEDVFNECRIVFTDPDMSLIGGRKLSAGVGVFVELGFQGKLKPVFEGEIVSVEPRFVRDHPPSVVVRALERLHRLALAPNTRSFNDVDAAEVVSIVAKENGLSGEGPKGSKGHLLQANQTDFQLLRKVAARTGCRISLQGKKLVVGPPPSLGEVECIPGEGLKRLKVKLRTTEQVPKVVVRGWDPKDKKEIVGQATPQGEAGEGANDAKPFGRTDFFIEGPLVRDTAEAEKIAKAAMGFIAERYAVAEGEILGNAEVLPGKVLNFDKMGELLDGKYRVTSTRHEFDKRGYRVGFTATRVAKKKSALKFKAPAAAPPEAAKPKAAPAAPAAAAQTPAAATPPPAVTTGLGADVDQLSSKSPTLTQNVQQLQSSGWTIKYGDAGKGSFADRQRKEIVIDSNAKGNTSYVTQVLAHESGHALYTPDPYVQPDGLTREQYVERNARRDLKDEGEATLVNAQVRNELIAAGAGDVGIAGSQSAKYAEIAAKYPDPKDRDQARDEIAQVFADGEHPSTDPGKTYGQYYGATYSDHWDKHIAPTRGGK